ncbi:hypothetical protein ROZALSC1DRAFT_22648 [Rozella allomycis CSF55]|uniref:Uncharacterized protein n=1 Tax=Rozella allomycis (strain CSF55) TaxID=988480 RepID=A0A4P9YHL5_ROZAC|nr:hypothetical protein ROZALSC1DRAFT_22648 [Rozella allomycis CSF55]
MDPKSDRLGNIFVSTFRVSKVSKGSSDKLFIHANCILAANDIKRDDLIAFHIREGQKYVEKEIGSSGSLFFYACVMCDQVLNENQAKAFVNLCIKSKQIVYSFKIYEVMTTRYLDVENICLEAEKLAKSNNRMDVKKYFEAVRSELLLQVAEKEIQNVSNSTWKRITLFMIYCYKIETFVSQERFEEIEKARGDYEAANVFYDLCARDCIELDLKVIALSHMLQIHVIGANTTEEIISIRKALVKIVDETQPYLAILLQIIDCISLIYYDDCVEARYP